MTPTVDVLVIGAGPAGSVAATTLASGGLQTLLVDRASFPRPKVCGDGLTPRALVMLEQLEVWNRLQSDAFLVRSVRTLDLRTGGVCIGPIPSRVRAQAEIGAVVRRDVLDDMLRRRALEAGALFQGGITIERVSEPMPGQCLAEGRAGRDNWRCTSRAVIVAEGAGGRLATQIGAAAPRLRGIALRQYWRCGELPSSFNICVPLESFHQSYAGYGWIFPVADGLANVGVGVYAIRNGSEVRAAFRNFMSRLREVSPEWRTAEPCGDLHGGSLLSGRLSAETVWGRIVLAGDAAGVTNPFTGEGIAQALESGELAARSVLDEFTSPGCLSDMVVSRSKRTFPETSRFAEHLPWLAARARQFVPEFWSAVSPPSALLAKAVRRIALEENLHSASRESEECVTRTWERLSASIAAPFPLLAQLVEAIHRESEAIVDAPLSLFWEGDLSGVAAPASDTEAIAELLLLAALICLLADGTRDAAGEASWAVNALTLGAVDMLVAQFFVGAARVPAGVSAHCARLLSEAIGFLTSCGLGLRRHAKQLDTTLRTLAMGFRQAARSGVATAA